MINTLYEKFQPWSAKGSVYILSDMHFNDPDCKLINPEWISADEQIEIINKTVLPSDTFVCLGDVGDPECVKKIKSKYKILILGNHDVKSKYKDLFDEIYDGPLFISSKILLSHEPIYFPYGINIHGHVHNGTFRSELYINLAADVCNYTPFNLGKEIKKGLIANSMNIHRAAIERQKEALKKCAN